MADKSCLQTNKTRISASTEREVSNIRWIATILVVIRVYFKIKMKKPRNNADMCECVGLCVCVLNVTLSEKYRSRIHVHEKGFRIS
jgi:hypothetical protein